MLYALVLLGLSTFGLMVEGREYCCSAQDRHIVEEQWESIWSDIESSAFRAGIGRHILLALAKAHPEVNELFKGVDIEHPFAGKFTAHALRIFDAIDTAINALEDPDVLDSLLDHLADQHQVRAGVKKAHFETLGKVLDTSLAHLLDHYDALSWHACFKGILAKISSKLQA